MSGSRLQTASAGNLASTDGIWWCFRHADDADVLPNGFASMAYVSSLTLSAGLGIAAGVSVSVARLRALAAEQGLRIKRPPWRGRVRLIACNDAVLRFPRDGHRWSGWQLRHALRFLLSLPDSPTV